jgi:hypothetical protein
MAEKMDWKGQLRMNTIDAVNYMLIAAHTVGLSMEKIRELKLEMHLAMSQYNEAEAREICDNYK